MEINEDKSVEYLIVDTSAFIQNAPLHNVASNILTCDEVTKEITNKRQLRRLVVLPYDLLVKDVFPENIQTVIEFSKKTGDYRSLSATDLKVIALTYQLEKEHVGIEHIKTEPLIQRQVNVVTNKADNESNSDVSGFYIPEEKQGLSDDILKPVVEDNIDYESDSHESDDEGWITPQNVQVAKNQINSELTEIKKVKVACMTTDFAMQNVLKQMNLNVVALDGKVIKQLRTFILRCYACFKTTSVMTKKFCPKCGNDTLKRVEVRLNEQGEQLIIINGKKPLTARGKKFSLPRIKGGKHSNNPLIVEDQPMPDQKPSRLARTKNNPLDDDYIAGYSPFVMRDVNSKSAQLKIRPNTDIKSWMKQNANEGSCRRRK